MEPIGPGVPLRSVCGVVICVGCEVIAQQLLAVPVCVSPHQMGLQQLLLGAWMQICQLYWSHCLCSALSARQFPASLPSEWV